MPIRTSAITYRRGIPNNATNFFLVAQGNYVIPQPISRFRQNYVSNNIAPTPPSYWTYYFTSSSPP